MRVFLMAMLAACAMALAAGVSTRGGDAQGVLTPTEACPNDCTGHGQCLGGQCYCNAGYAGVDCASRVCPNFCSGHGMCIHGACTCDPGYSGEDCSRDVAVPAVPLGAVSSVDHVWSTDAEEVKEAVIKCPTKTAKHEKACPGDCSAHGACVDGVCQCYDEWKGEDCGAAVCENNCNGHGVCVNKECVCDPLYEGDVCETFMGTPGVVAPPAKNHTAQEIENAIMEVNSTVHLNTTKPDNVTALLSPLEAAELEGDDLVEAANTTQQANPNVPVVPLNTLEGNTTVLAIGNSTVDAPTAPATGANATVNLELAAEVAEEEAIEASLEAREEECADGSCGAAVPLGTATTEDNEIYTLTQPEDPDAPDTDVVMMLQLMQDVLGSEDSMEVVVN